MDQASLSRSGTEFQKRSCILFIASAFISLFAAARDYIFSSQARNTRQWSGWLSGDQAGGMLCMASCTAGIMAIMIAHSPTSLPATPGFEDGLPCGGLGRIKIAQGSACRGVGGVFTVAPPLTLLCWLHLFLASVFVLTVLLRCIALFFIFPLSCLCS